MGDFPGQACGHIPVISSLSPEAAGGSLQGSVNVAGQPIASGAWPAANRGLFVPFALRTSYLVTRLWWFNGATANSNIDCGIYTNGGGRLTSTTPTAQAGTSVVQSVAVTALLLTPGQYYMALSVSATTGTFFRSSTAQVSRLNLAGIGEQASVGTLPATFTLITVTSNYFPVFGISSASVI